MNLETIRTTKPVTPAEWAEQCELRDTLVHDITATMQQFVEGVTTILMYINGEI